jgi:hypothetical protein
MIARLRGNRGCPTLAHCVKSRDILYKVSLDILYSGEEELGLGIQRSMIFERWIPGSSSRIRVVQ